MREIRVNESIAELTVRAVVTGVALGIVFGAANAYLGLRVGLTVSASIPAAVMTVALFRVLGSRASILEANRRRPLARRRRHSPPGPSSPFPLSSFGE